MQSMLLPSYSNFLDPASTNNIYFTFNCSEYRELKTSPNNSTIDFQKSLMILVILLIYCSI